MSKTIPPNMYKDAFNCPRCGVLVPQNWYRVNPPSSSDSKIPTFETYDSNKLLIFRSARGSNGRSRADWNLCITVCSRCNNYGIWENQNLIYPFETGLPEPHEDMYEDVKGIYHEAMLVYQHSPRAAAALLRLAIETMIPQLEEYQITKAKINTMIGELVKKEIPEHIQQGLDFIRIYGNEGIHPGEITLKDNQETVMFLFELINIMVEELITRKKKIKSFYASLPSKKIEGIINRDK